MGICCFIGFMLKVLSFVFLMVDVILPVWRFQRECNVPLLFFEVMTNERT